MGLNIGGGEAGLPFLKFDARAGRIENKADDGTTAEVRDLVAVFDLERIRTGWAKFQAGAAPEWYADPDLTTVAPRPAGVGEDGKPAFKRAVKLQVFSQKTLGNGPREVLTNSLAVCGAVSELYDAYTDAAESKNGMLPVVKVAEWVKSDKNGNRKPVFAIVKWVPRPHELSDGGDDDFPARPTKPAAAPAVPPPQRKAAPPPPAADDGDPEF
jgi:hypothetical protein